MLIYQIIKFLAIYYFLTQNGIVGNVKKLMLLARSSHLFLCIPNYQEGVNDGWIEPIYKTMGLERRCAGIFVGGNGWALSGNARECMQIDPIAHNTCPLEERQQVGEAEKWRAKVERGGGIVKRKWISQKMDGTSSNIECEIKEVHELMDYSSAFGQMSLLKLDHCNDTMSTSKNVDSSTIYPIIFNSSHTPLHQQNAFLFAPNTAKTVPFVHEWSIKQIVNTNENVICGMEEKIMPENNLVVQQLSNSSKPLLEGAPAILFAGNSAEMHILGIKTDELSKNGCLLRFNDQVCSKIEEITGNEIQLIVGDILFCIINDDTEKLSKNL